MCEARTLIAPCDSQHAGRKGNIETVKHALPLIKSCNVALAGNVLHKTSSGIGSEKVKLYLYFTFRFYTKGTTLFINDIQSFN